MSKILLVEDDNNLREIYEARLAAEGYTIVTAPDGEAALAIASQEKPDLVISDVMMPNISGFDMLDIMRNTEGLKNVHVIMLTALSQAEDQARADALGADRYLVKSQVTLEDIVNNAKTLLGDVEEPVPQASEPAPTTEAVPVAVAPVATPPVTEPIAVEVAPVAAPEPVAVTPEPAVVTETPVITEPVTAPASDPVAAVPDPTPNVAVAPAPVAPPAEPVSTPVVPVASPVDDVVAPPIDTSVPTIAAPAPDPAVVTPVPEPPIAPSLSTPVAAPVVTSDEPLTPAPAPAPEPTSPAEPVMPPVAEPVATPAPDSEPATPSVTEPTASAPAASDIISPSPAAQETTAPTSADAQTLAQEEAAIQAQINQFANESVATPAQAEPTPVAAAPQITTAESATTPEASSEPPVQAPAPEPSPAPVGPEISGHTNLQANPTNDATIDNAVTQLLAGVEGGAIPAPATPASDSEAPSGEADTSDLPVPKAASDGGTKVIQPLTNIEPRPDINQLLAQEEANEAGTIQAPPLGQNPNPAPNSGPRPEDIAL